MKSMLVIALATVIVGYTSVRACKPEILKQDLCQSSSLVLSNSKVTVDVSNCHEQFKAKDFTEKPRIKWSAAEKDSRYTFLLVGTNIHLHAGSGNLPTDFTFIFSGTNVNFHWAVTDITATTFLNDGNISSFNEIAEYRPMMKNPGIGVMESYRYQALILRQRSQMRRTARPDPVIERVKFNLTKFVKEQDLLCEPVAAIQAWIDLNSLEISF